MVGLYIDYGTWMLQNALEKLDIYKNNYTTIQMFGVGKMFNVFERSVLCSIRLHLFDHKYSKNL